MPLIFPADEPSRRLGYAQNVLDRMSERRGDAAWMAELAASPEARFIVFCGDKVVVDPRGRTTGGQPTLRLDRSRALGIGMAEDPALLGLAGDMPSADDRMQTAGRAGWFAGLSPVDEAAVVAAGLDLIDLRSLVLTGVVPADEASAAAQGRALFNWHGTHGFCARCGSASLIAEAGYRRDCPSCQAQHFPRTDPVVIMAIVHGDRILLGRQARFPPGMYSCLAGFLEPGETIEAAVRRETWEEAGIRVGSVIYHSSQPWPFPASLMIGCIGEAETTDIVPDETELEDCRWFTRADSRAMLADAHPDGITSPKPIAIAHHLLQAFIAGE